MQLPRKVEITHAVSVHGWFAPNPWFSVFGWWRGMLLGWATYFTDTCLATPARWLPLHTPYAPAAAATLM